MSLESGVGSQEVVMADQTTRQCELRKVEANKGGGYETGRDAALWPFERGCKGLPYSM